jgi:hypothetical protein
LKPTNSQIQQSECGARATSMSKDTRVFVDSLIKKIKNSSPHLATAVGTYYKDLPAGLSDRHAAIQTLYDTETQMQNYSARALNYCLLIATFF